MNPLKKSIFIIGLALSLVACQNNEANLTANSPTDKEPQKLEDTAKEDTTDIEEKTEEEDIFNQGTEKERLNVLMRESDYISRVEMATTADHQTELRIITNYKGNLSNIEFEAPEGLEENQEYLIFYHDDEDGNIVPTNGKDSFLEIKGDEADEYLSTVEQTYLKIEKDDGTINKGESKKASDTEKTTDVKKTTNSKDKETSTDSGETTKKSTTKTDTQTEKKTTEGKSTTKEKADTKGEERIN